MSTVNTPLKYKFIAHYSDETSFTQPDDDTSVVPADKDGHRFSAFHDVDQEKLISFSLVNPEGSYTVSLESGLFYVQGKPICLHDQFLNPEEFKLRLIYFREVRKDFIDGIPQEPRINRYFIGWQAEVHGKNYKYTLGVA